MLKQKRVFKKGQRVSLDSGGSQWGVIVEVIALKDAFDPKTPSGKMRIKALNRSTTGPFKYRILLDSGETIEFKPSSVSSLWIAGDKNLKRETLIDPRVK